MVGEKVFVPNILLCGDEVEFTSLIDNRPYKIVGHAQFYGEANGQKFNFAQDGNFLMNDKFCTGEELTNLISSGSIDFIVFNSCGELAGFDRLLKRFGCLRGYGISAIEFKYLPTDNLHYLHADMDLMSLLEKLSIKTLLDVDGYLANSLMLTKSPNETTLIDCIYDSDFCPMKNDFFRHVYKNFSECTLRHYEAALISEDTPGDFDKAFNFLKNTTDLVITFARNNSELAKHVQDNKDNFKKVDVYPCFPTGQWIFCYRHTAPQDFAMYVVTHKVLPPEHIKTFPDKYIVINAGAAMRDDLGYLRDDTGENISKLNPYINELTAVYWVWKNTSHTAVGFCHYRRFFQLEKNGTFLTEAQALKFLEDYDVLTRTISLNRGTFLEIRKIAARDKVFIEFVRSVIRKNLLRIHPDYIEIFDNKMYTSSVYFNNSFVMHKNVFDAYCEWLFSFLIDSFEEISAKQPLVNRKTRTVGFFGEQLFTVWLMKNHLRVKELRYVEKDPFTV